MTAISCLLTELQGSSKHAELITLRLILSWCNTVAPVISTEHHHSAQTSTWFSQRLRMKGRTEDFCSTRWRKDSLHGTHTFPAAAGNSDLHSYSLTIHTYPPSSTAQLLSWNNVLGTWTFCPKRTKVIPERHGYCQNKKPPITCYGLSRKSSAVLFSPSS